MAGTSTGSSSKAKKTYLRVVQTVQLTSHPLRMPKVDEPAFTNKNARRLHHPHDNAIVITLTIANYTTRKVLVDNGSCVDILYYPAFQQIRVTRNYFIQQMYL